jgi:hypothetical protein
VRNFVVTHDKGFALKSMATDTLPQLHRHLITLLFLPTTKQPIELTKLMAVSQEWFTYD